MNGPLMQTYSHYRVEMICPGDFMQLAALVSINC
jgi:hypothetical protein